MSQSDSSQLSSGPPSPALPGSPEKPSGNRFDTMFGSDAESEPPKDDLDNLSDEDDEEAGTRKRVLRAAAVDDDNSIKEEDEEEHEEVGDDLFGDEDEDEVPKRPAAADDELEGTPEIDDEDREPSPQKEETYLDIQVPRHPAPQPGRDGQIYLLRTSNITLEPRLFYPEKFDLPKAPSGGSAYTAATSAIRIRPNPTDLTKLQSNARIIRWSDGTLSLQVASSPALYDLPQKQLAPPPTSSKYDPAADSHTYLMDPLISAGFLRVCGHATTSLGCQPASGSVANDSAVERLQQMLVNPRQKQPRTLEMQEMIDPEAQRKQQEAIARQKERDNRKKENLRRKREDRDDGLGLGAGGAVPRARYRGSGTRSKRDSPPISGSRGRGKEDEYDLEDEFIEGSDEEEEVVDEDSEEEESEAEVRRKHRGEERAGKRRRVVDESDEE